MPLSDLKVVDLSTIIAGPFASALLGDFGADVVKIELPEIGDSLRLLPPHKDGVPLWWKVTNRNKKGITLDIRTPEGKELFRELISWADVLVENFRPGTLDRYGFSAQTLEEINAKLIVLRVSGFGQTGPMSGEPGFARIAEAFSGFTYLCGEVDGPPLHLGYPISDAVAGIFGAFGILLACLRRANGAVGIEEIDVSLAESMFRLLEFSVIEHDQLGTSRKRFGNGSKYAGPSNIYRSKDGHWVSLSASTQRVFERFAKAIGRPDILCDPKYLTNANRVQHAQTLDKIVQGWFGERSLQDALDALRNGDVPVSRVNPIEDVINSDHMKSREAVVRVPDPELGEVAMQGVYPRLKQAPGSVRRTGPSMGQHNDDIFRGLLGISKDRFDALKTKGVI